MKCFGGFICVGEGSFVMAWKFSTFVTESLAKRLLLQLKQLPIEEKRVLLNLTSEYYTLYIM